ncbi:putative leucine-rich repeat receptor-like protein kinase At2g19210 [Amborella trichopoda]|uniref:putative leucine-rich repeat receptor-like protein kinase At2g19210 n=1 Tax=Amborella trichopoda TaxID=13333 RepID=UPI0009C029E4|nr:putative leucine-rich repeat receptor-like protein kinase At2g19210 [Amborella trichopoda]|eukprot:XP_020528658.1 putative leucine-rich repeat receptor-like protein kinase At2g19210 [Amborella trichopoda]
MIFMIMRRNVQVRLATVASVEAPCPSLDQSAGWCRLSLLFGAIDKWLRTLAVDALMDIKREYALKGWLGDPCLPKGYSWDVLSCSNAPFPRIISLNLKGYELMGEILRALGNLQEIQIL